MRKKQNNDLGPIRIPENNDFSCPTTAKLPVSYEFPVLFPLLLWPCGGTPCFWWIRWAWDHGAKWALPAANNITRGNFGGLRSGLDQVVVQSAYHAKREKGRS